MHLCRLKKTSKHLIQHRTLFAFSAIVSLLILPSDFSTVKQQGASVLFAPAAHAAESSLSSNERDRIKTGKGSVIMFRGDVVTIRLDQKKRSASIGDRVELSFSVDGEVIPVGTWRVSRIREDGTLEAEPVEMKGKPNIGMDAVLFAQQEKPSAEKRVKPSEKGSATYQQPEPKSKEKVSVEKESKPKSIDEILTSYSKTAVPIAFSGAGESLPCASGTIRILPDKVEISATGESKWEHCIFKVSDELFDNFFASFKLSVDTNSHHHFHAGIVYGIKPGG
ncbi:MAG: hypothetical protein AB1649_20010, partial [Chloroflexota bacterium]